MRANRLAKRGDEELALVSPSESDGSLSPRDRRVPDVDERAARSSTFWVLAAVLVQIPLYSLNEVILAASYDGGIEAVDMGGSMFVHTFGAVSGVAMSFFLRRRRAPQGGALASDVPERPERQYARVHQDGRHDDAKGHAGVPVRKALDRQVHVQTAHPTDVRAPHQPKCNPHDHGNDDVADQDVGRV